MRYLIIGSGGREHCIYWRLLHDKSANEIYMAPGNGGIPGKYRLNIGVEDHKGIARACIEKKIDIAVVGPEVPLVNGLVDYLAVEKIPAFGPSKKAAMIEGSKIFAKEIMNKYKIPTAGFHEFTDKSELVNYIKKAKRFPLVIKLDGLAAGKGVGIPETKEEALAFTEQNVKENTRVFIEDFLRGEEVSVLGISDGENIAPLAAAQDHKRIFEDDKGPNTGGMGAYAPTPLMNKTRLGKIHKEILEPVIRGMKNEGIIFRGVLYAGLIIDGDDIKILEFNARFGDPETQVILPLLNNRLGDIIEKSINGGIGDIDITFLDKSAVTVVMSSGGYPGPYQNGKEITGLDRLSDNIIVFHAGTEFKNGRHVTNGGRVLNVTAMGDDFTQARDRVYSEIDKIQFEGAYYRKDIGHRAAKYMMK